MDDGLQIVQKNHNHYEVATLVPIKVKHTDAAENLQHRLKWVPLFPSEEPKEKVALKTYTRIPKSVSSHSCTILLGSVLPGLQLQVGNGPKLIQLKKKEVPPMNIKTEPELIIDDDDDDGDEV